MAANPWSFDAHYQYGFMLWMYLRRNKEAVQHLEKALALKPSHLDARFVLAQSLGELKEFSRAEALLREAMAMGPHDAQIRFELGELFYTKSLHAAETLDRWVAMEAAAQAYRQTLRLNPNHPHAQWSLSRTEGKMAREQAELQKQSS